MPPAVDGAALAARLRQYRREIYGDHGAAELARRLGVPERTWLNYEAGVVVPGRVLLRFLLVTGLEPAWLAGEPVPPFRRRVRAAGAN